MRNANFAQPPMPFAPLRPTAPAFAPHSHEQHEHDWHRYQPKGASQAYHTSDVSQESPQANQPYRKRPLRADRRSDRRNARRQVDEPEQIDSSGFPTPVPFKRRQKSARETGAPPPPSDEYLASTLLPVSTFSPTDPRPESPLLILDLNNTLLCRRRRDANSSKRPIIRPYLSTFLQYVCGRDADGQRRWNVAVYSSAALHNVLSLLEAARLVSVTRAHEHDRERRGQGWDALDDEPLRLVWSREKMGLSAKEFELNVETVKDLDQISDALPGFGSERTVLLDDEAGKAVSCVNARWLRYIGHLVHQILCRPNIPTTMSLFCPSSSTLTRSTTIQQTGHLVTVTASEDSYVHHVCHPST